MEPDIAGPLLHAGAGAAVLGRVTLGRNAWLGALSVMRADGHFVRVGDDFHLGARSTLHINHEIFPCIVGNRVAVGRNACVHACTVGSDVVIGDGVVILDGAVVEDNVVLEGGSTVFPNKRVPGGFLYAGSPAKPVRALGAGEVAERRQQMIAERDAAEPGTQTSAAMAAVSSVHASVFIASTATVAGRIAAAESASVWYSNTLDAGAAAISIGARTNIQDNTIIRCATAQGVSIGRDSAVGHNVLIHDCVIGDRTLIGIGSTVAAGTVVGDRVLLAAAARTTPGQVLESGWMYAGTPARKFAQLDDAKHALTALIVLQYCQYAQDFKALEREASGAA
ncbi:MAG: gamma carbonic anhydrase family protein [Alphaproteobacteria bacterium]|nr:MAG: gamma carbonic anhydrase family protein [Alphaproteobacteria bacterium]